MVAAEHELVRDRASQIAKAKSPKRCSAQFSPHFLYAAHEHGAVGQSAQRLRVDIESPRQLFAVVQAQIGHQHQARGTVNERLLVERVLLGHA